MAGVNTEIIEVVVPASAQVGVAVSVQVKIKNTTEEALDIMAGGALEYGVTPRPAISITNGSTEVAAGETETFTGSFVMPSSDVTVYGSSYYYDETEEAWIPDDEATNGVTLAEAPTTGIDMNQIISLMVVVMMMSMMMKAMK